MLNKFNISPFGEGIVTEILHQGKTFNLYRANLCGKDVVLKTPSPHVTGEDIYAYNSYSTSEIFVTSELGIDKVFDHPNDLLDPIKVATWILLVETQLINWTRGRWNHSIIGLGTWDGLSQIHGNKEVYNTSEPLDLRFLPVLIMPDYEATPFSKLPAYSKRLLFPQMLPALWDALCYMHHGDLSESNILISQKQNIFHIIDPGVVLASDSGKLFGLQEQYIFTTTSANYPLLPPYLGDSKAVGIVECLKYFGREMKPSNRIPAPSLSEVQQQSNPSMSDLLALGIIYYRILTGKEIFLGQDILPDKPAWLHSYMSPQFPQWEIYHRVLDFLSNHYIDRELDKSTMSNSERKLVYALLNLEIHNKNDLLRLSAF
ncbi:hypothetical protein [Calothrix sp. NIES-2098]|uniref:hypothetical protein n=1 Tax=Calothrix sp. NIES-2098 TaxID=1954171 RepID=UPI000B5E9659|nr:hypothetical protein NIES2098_49940 [Calothrix sp. NIES-2098]